MKKTVIIHRGIPASGKSTCARAIVETFEHKGIHAVAHSTDSRFVVDGVYRFDPEKLRAYHLKNQEAFASSLEQGIELVICDNTNIEPWEARPYYDLAKTYGYDVLMINFLPRSLEEHIEAQSNEGYRHNIPAETLRDMYERYHNYEELTQKHSFPKQSIHPKRGYDESTGRVEMFDEPSEPFYYDALIKIAARDYPKIQQHIGEMVYRKLRDYDREFITLIPGHYRTIMEEFHKRPDRTLSPYELEPILERSPKQIGRMFDDLREEFHNIIEVKKGRQKAYKLFDSFDVFLDAFKQRDDVNDLLYLLSQSSPNLFKSLEHKSTLNGTGAYLFRNPIYEEIQNRDIFNALKKAITHHEYRMLRFSDEAHEIEAKCIKLVFVDNNWYLAYADPDDTLRLGRVSFIKHVGYSRKNSYQIRSIDKHLKALERDLQNAMTRFDQTPQKATLKASPAIARYFRPDMKKFFISQQFLKKQEDGSVLFTLRYTQPLEILPFVQKWLPDLVILEPAELREAYRKKLQQAVEQHGSDV